MPCAGPQHSCNTLLSIRSPLGEVRLGSPPAAGERPSALVRFAWWVRETVAHRRQRRELARLDAHLLRDIGVPRADAEAESRKLLG